MITTIINQVFTEAGFTVLEDYSSTQMFNYKDGCYAIPRIKKTEVSKIVTGRGLYVGQEMTVTAAVRCLGADCGFSDSSELAFMIKKAERGLMFDRAENIRWISTGEAVRDNAVGRLSVTVLIEMTVYDDREVEVDEE